MRCTQFAAAVLAAISCAPCFAQPAEDVIPADIAIPITIDQIQGGDYLRGYSPRNDLEVYQIGTPQETGGVFAGSGTNVYDDVTFGGPYLSNSTPLALNGMAFGIIIPAVYPPVNGDHIYTRVSFYPNHDNTAPTTITPYSGTPIVATIDWGSGWAMCDPGACSVRYYSHCVTFGGNIATLSTADVFDGGATDRTAGVMIEPYNDAACSIRATEYQILRRTGFASIKVGSSDTFGWFQAGPPPIANSARTGGGAFNPVFSTTPPTNSGGNCRATYMGFQGTGLSNCGSSDFDGNGDSGTDADIQAFFECLGGDCCAACWYRGSDFNGDGDFGTDADIESFFRVLAGANC